MRRFLRDYRHYGRTIAVLNFRIRYPRVQAVIRWARERVER